MKYEILKNDSIQIKHPITGLPVKLYRIIANIDFGCSVGSSLIEKRTIHICAGTIGGYIQSEKNLPQDDNSWVNSNSRVFDNVVLENSFITGDAQVFGNSIISSSIISDKVRIYGSADLRCCSIFDNVDIYGSSKLVNSLVKNSCIICGNSIVTNTEVLGGSRICDSRVINSRLLDQSEIRKRSEVENCKLSGRAVIVNKKVSNETLSETIELNVIAPDWRD